jgi:hypothetical protein
MKNDNASARAVALVNQTLDVLQRIDRAPKSPVSERLTPKRRRQFRRGALQLRRGNAEPRYKNLHTSEELADVYEWTARRDEIFEQASKDFRRITFALGRVLEENDPEVPKAIGALIAEIERAAEENGPGSEAAQRYRRLHFLSWFGRKAHDYRRRGRTPPPANGSLASDPSVEARHQLYALELLASPPSSDETVIMIPPEGSGSGRGRMFMRIGFRESSWICSFECGNKCVSTASLLPGDKHLFVSANGAGYIIDAKSRTLVETIGTDVVGTMSNQSRTLFFVNHDNLRLEAFGKSGRLWRTGPIGSGDLRGMALEHDALVGQARHRWGLGWVTFAVELATGDTWLAD